MDDSLETSDLYWWTSGNWIRKYILMPYILSKGLLGQQNWDFYVALVMMFLWQEKKWDLDSGKKKCFSLFLSRCLNTLSFLIQKGYKYIFLSDGCAELCREVTPIGKVFSASMLQLLRGITMHNAKWKTGNWKQRTVFKAECILQFSMVKINFNVSEKSEDV